jgi:glycerophosphoryl diester phosphodiesterase
VVISLALRRRDKLNCAILTHRGIDIPLGTLPSHITGESSWEAFSAQVGAGFGLEFDIQPLRDGGFAVSHDSHLGRVSQGKLNIPLSKISRKSLYQMKLLGGRLCDLHELLSLLVEHSKGLSALHLKHNCQSNEVLALLVSHLQPYLDMLVGRLILFDVVPSAAIRLKSALPNIEIAASVAHPFDIQRYNSIVGGTLLTVDEVIRQRSIYSWAWLDEWDRLGPNGEQKSLVNPSTLERLHVHKFKVAAVSPELHATSPALLGGEVHEDGVSPVRLEARWKEWIGLGIDAMCTDHASWFTDNMCGST